MLDFLILAASVVIVAAVVASHTGRSIFPRDRWPRFRLPDVVPATQDHSGDLAVSRDRPRTQAVTRPLAFSRWHGLVIVSTAASIYVWTSERSRPVTDGRADIVLAWIVSIGALVLAVWQPAPGTSADARAWLGKHRADLTIAAVLTLLAAVPMFWRLDSYPWAFNGDEGQFTLAAKEILDGQPVDPFGTGWLGHAHLFNFAQAAAMAVVGESVTGARTVSALFGVVSVPLEFVLVSRIIDRQTGVMAAILLATFHVHIYWSRVAMNNGASSFFVLLTILLLTIAIRNRSALAFLASGMAVGMAQYFYLGNRVLVIAIALVMLWDIGRAVADGSRDWLRATRRLGEAALAAAGMLVVALPLLAHYRSFPEQFNARQEQVSIFATGWLDAQRDAGRNVIVVLLDQFLDAALIPFSSINTGQYRGDSPFVGRPISTAVLVGLVVVTSRFYEERFLPIAVTYWVAVTALVTVVPPVESNRYVLATPLLCAFAAIAITATVNTVRRWFSVSARTGTLVASCAVAVISVWSLHYYFHDPNQVSINSDRNTQVSEYLARDIIAVDPTATVYFAGPPRMWFDGFANLVFRTPDATGISVEQPWTDQSVRPEIDGTTIFVFLPERADELAVIQSWYPGGDQFERSNDEVGILYTAYVLRPPP